MAPPPASGFFAASAAGSHTNAFFRAVLNKCRSPQTKITENGFLSAGKLSSKGPEWRDVFEKGLRWTIISYCVEDRWPDLVDIVQQFGNIPQQAALPESDISIMQKLHSMASESLRRGALDAAQWDNICRVAALSHPPCESYIKELAKYVQRYSGGSNEKGVHLKELEAFLRTFASGSRRVSGAFITALNSVDFGCDFEAVLLRNAVFKCHAACSESKVTNNECHFVTASDIKNLAKNRTMAKEAEAVMVKARELVKPLPQAKQTRLLGELDVRIAKFVMQKKDGDHTVFETLGGIGQACWEAACDSFPGGSIPASPWPPDEAKDDAKLAKDDQQKVDENGFVSLDAKGNLEDKFYHVKQASFKQGSLVEHKTNPDGTAYIIKEFCAKDGRVHIVAEGRKGVASKVLPQLFLGVWTSRKPSNECLDWKEPGENEHFEAAALRACVQMSLHSCCDTSDQVSLRDKPKSAHADIAFATCKLTLVPSTTSIAILPAGQAGSCVAVLKVPDREDKVRFQLSVASSVPCPFWFVRTSNDKDDCNMELSAQVVTSTATLHRQKKRKVGSGDATNGLSVEMPIMVNFCNVSAGDELVCFKAEAEKAQAKRR